MPYIVDHIDVKDGLIYSQRPGYYFGYGLESDPEVMDTIAGHPLRAELGVVAIYKQLAIQEVDQTPDTPVEELGKKSIQQILTDTWSKYTDVPFSSYTLLDSKNRSDTVRGTLYELDMLDASKLNEWDLALPFYRAAGKVVYPGWRGPASVELVDGRKVFTLSTYPEQTVDRVVDGQVYNPFLNNRELTMRIIQEVMNGPR